MSKKKPKNTHTLSVLYSSYGAVLGDVVPHLKPKTSDCLDPSLQGHNSTFKGLSHTLERIQIQMATLSFK